MTSRTLRRAVAIASAICLIAATGSTARATSTVYAALGDSYSAGVGTWASSDPACYRSPYGFPALVAQRNGLALHYQACSGATTAEVSSKQLGVLNADTGFVSLVVGGNDVGFTSVIIECAKPGWISNCSGAIRNGYTVLNGPLPARFDALYAAIRTKAPNATIAVGGYPRLFNGTDCNLATFFSSSEMTALNKAADDIDALISKKATGFGFSYVDPRPAFVAHAVCDRTEWINGLSNPLNESYHPNRSGNASYADLFAPLLKASQPTPASIAEVASDGADIPADLTQPTPTLRQRADVVLGWNLASRTNLAKARAAGISPRTVAALNSQLRSPNPLVVTAALSQLQILDAQHERRTT